MAFYAALLSTIELLEDILHPHRFPNSFPPNITPTFSSLLQKFTQLLNSLQDYSFVGCDVDPVEVRIKDASYEALDLIESQIHEHQPASKTKPEKESLRFDWKEKLQKVGREVDSIVEHLAEFKQTQMSEHQHVPTAASESPPPLASIDIGSRMVGFEDQELAIKEQLCGSSLQLQVIPIVGMGGIGKTTLAINTFHDPLIVCTFDFRGWVTISQDYHVIRVLQDIVKSLGIIVSLQCELERERGKERALKDGIHKHLKWRKFLITIDDVWDTQVWDDIKHIFPNDSNGSRIMLTTRLGDVAEYVGCANSVHCMQFLNVDASWNLLREKAFGNDPCPSELVNIGKGIAAKCSGLPIAIVVIGGVLSNDKTLSYWKNVAKGVGSILIKDDEHLHSIISLSYNHLPHHLKPCFLHLGSFPEDSEINISDLIKLWIAEGFLKTVSKSKNLEEIGSDYLESLVKKNLVIITKKKASGEFKSCVMHDSLRDFCRQKAADEYFFHIIKEEGCLDTNGLEKVRRIFVGSNVLFKSWLHDGNVKYVRSIFQFRTNREFIDVDELNWDRANLLRSLDINSVSIPVIVSTISKMSHLKHLVLRLELGEESVDPSISNLRNLETMIIYGYAWRTISLPSEIWKMRWLKYLIFHEVKLPPIPLDASLQKLECLDILRTVKNFVFTNEVIQMIPNLKKLNLTYDWEDQDAWNSCGLNNMVNMLQLEKLEINLDDFPRVPALVKSGFAFPQNLKKLTLWGTRLSWEEMSLVGSLKRLQVLKLRYFAFSGEVWEPVEGEFLELKFLLLYLLNLKIWRAEHRHFPKLQHLKIDNCSDLEEIPGDIGEIGTIKFITVNWCHKKMEDSAKKIEEEQRELGNFGLQVIVRSRR